MLFNSVVLVSRPMRPHLKLETLNLKPAVYPRFLVAKKIGD